MSRRPTAPRDATPAERARIALALQIPCAVCQAEAGRHCRTPVFRFPTDGVCTTRADAARTMARGSPCAVCGEPMTRLLPVWCFTSNVPEESHAHVLGDCCDVLAGPTHVMNDACPATPEGRTYWKLERETRRAQRGPRIRATWTMDPGLPPP